MKRAEYYLDNLKIEIYTPVFGEEFVLVNNHRISEQKSSTKKPHQFELGGNSYSIATRVYPKSLISKKYDVYKNGEKVILTNFKTQNSITLLFLIVVLGITLGYLIGIYLYQWFPSYFEWLQ